MKLQGAEYNILTETRRHSATNVSVDRACATSAKILLRTEDPNHTTEPKPNVAFRVVKVKTNRRERERDEKIKNKKEKV